MKTEKHLIYTFHNLKTPYINITLLKLTNQISRNTSISLKYDTMFLLPAG